MSTDVSFHTLPNTPYTNVEEVTNGYTDALARQILALSVLGLAPRVQISGKGVLTVTWTFNRMTLCDKNWRLYAA